MINEHREIKIGVLFSYLLILASTLYGLLATPYILKIVGDSAYGVYKSVASISASLAVMDLGLGTTMIRYTAKYYATDDKKSAETFIGMMLMQFFLIAIAIACVGIGLVILLPGLYSKSFSLSEVSLARELLGILVLNMILRLFENLLFGILSGYERFTISNGCKLINLVLKFGLIIVLLPIIKNVKVVVFSDTVLVIASIAFYLVYITSKMHIIPKFKRWDNVLFKESFGYTLLMFIQSLTVQFNGNVDNVLIGTEQGASFVTIYSMALLVFGMYGNLSGSIANIMLPKVTKQVVNGVQESELQKTVEKAGRYQFILSAAALGGFTILGKDFYRLWLGDSFTDCYILTLILIIPGTLPMVQNVSLSILRAENKMVYRTVTLAISCLCNIIITFKGVQLWGYWGAAVGTAFAEILNLVMMNLYYHKVLHFSVLKMFFNILKGILPAAVISSIGCGIIHYYCSTTWMSFIICTVIFLVIYGVSLVLFGLNKVEKEVLFGKIVGERK